jgi:hypothetical protein
MIGSFLVVLVLTISPARDDKALPDSGGGYRVG